MLKKKNTRSIGLDGFVKPAPRKVSKKRGGFFPEGKRPKKANKTKSSKETVYSCEVCGLFKNCTSPKMPYHGQGKKEILIVGEFLEYEEDIQNDQFVGRSGEFLKNQLEEHGIDLNEDCWKQNVIRCCLMGDKKPTRKELKCCWPLLVQDIKKLNPKFIILMGGKAVESFFMEKFTNLTMFRWRGLCIPDQDRFNAWIMPIFHPAHIIQNMDDENLVLTWERDLKFAVSCFKKPGRPKETLLGGGFAQSYSERFTSEVEALFKPEKIIDALLDASFADLISFDYETTSLVPFGEGQKIWSISCAWKKVADIRTISFALNHPTIDYGNKREIIFELWRSILQNPNIGKVAHNCLHGKTRILMEDGSEIPIRTLVDKKTNKKVACYDDKGNLTTARILTYFQNREESIYWYSIKIKTKQNRDKGSYPKLICTENHEIYTDRGKLKAKDLELRDKVMFIGGANKDLEDIFIGSFLGDGSLVKTGNCYYWFFGNSLQQINYLKTLKKYISDCGFNTTNIEKQTRRGFDIYFFRVTATPYFRELSKKLNTLWCLENLNLKSLAKWYLDDGSLYTYPLKNSVSYSVRIRCSRFTKNQGMLAANRINSLIGINSCYFKNGNINIGTRDTEKFLSKITTYMSIGSKDLHYKNPLVNKVKNFYIWRTNKTFFYVPIEKIEIKKQSWRAQRYDLEIEKHHNYIAEGIKVSNSKFEDCWSREYFGIKEVQGWHWCTMTTAHILDSRKAFTGLKFQSYIKFGIMPYDDSVKGFIAPKTGENINRLDQVPVEDLLFYGGMDARATLELYYLQKKQLRPTDPRLAANSFFLEGLKTLADIQMDGVVIDPEYYKRTTKKITTDISVIEGEIRRSDEAKKFEKNTQRKFDIKTKDYSTKDLREMFYNVLGLESVKRTKKGFDSVDRESFERIKNLLAKKILKRRRLLKLRDTYLEQFTRSSDQKKIHPFLDLHNVASYRSCIAKGSLVLSLRENPGNPKGTPIEEIKVGDYVYCFDDNLNPAIRRVLWAGKTGHKKVVRIYWYGGRKRGFLDLTEDHPVRLATGEYVKVKDLMGKDFRKKKDSKKAPKMRVLSCNRKDDFLNFTGHINSNNKGIKEHRLIYEHFSGKKLSKLDIIHHVDGNHFNNTFDNLRVMDLVEHGRAHYNLDRYREKNIRVVKEGWKQGKYDHIIKRGIEHPNYLNLSRWACLKLIAKAKGKPTRVEYDFQTFKNYLELHGIDFNLVRLRYDKEGKYISRSRLKKLHEKYSHRRLQKVLGCNYYNLKKLFEFYDIPIKKRIINQYGEYTPGNHGIYKIEKLNETVDVYNLEVEEFHNFFANEICVKNSSNHPNLQNQPKRDEEAAQYIRSGFFPHPGQRFVEADYSQLEVRVIACASKDPRLIEYIQDPTTDMHGDQSKVLFFLNKKQMTKDLRFHAKNGFVFAQFYGSSFKPCAANLWKDCLELKTGENITLKKHLANNGVKNFNDWLYHVEKCERAFWSEFDVIREWQKEQIDRYRITGYVETFFGFRRSGYLTENQIINTPIQSSAFHLLLYAMIELNKQIKSLGLKSRIMFEIHDSIGISVEPGEMATVVNLLHECMVVQPTRKFNWLLVPLDIDIEAGGINESWYSIKKIPHKRYLEK